MKRKAIASIENCSYFKRTGELKVEKVGQFCSPGARSLARG
jgi:hypothetical protein